MEDKDKVQEGDMLPSDNQKVVAAGLVVAILGILIAVGIIVILLCCLASADHTPSCPLPRAP